MLLGRRWETGAVHMDLWVLPWPILWASLHGASGAPIHCLLVLSVKAEGLLLGYPMLPGGELENTGPWIVLSEYILDQEGPGQGCSLVLGDGFWGADWVVGAAGVSSMGLPAALAVGWTMEFPVRFSFTVILWHNSGCGMVGKPAPLPGLFQAASLLLLCYREQTWTLVFSPQYMRLKEHSGKWYSVIWK